MIQLINVSKTYKSISNSTNALSNINVEFEDHGFVFILGPSGSGKTTLLNVIGGLDKIDEGNIIIDDKDISNYKSHELDYYRNEQVGFIFQNYNLIDHLNIYENISLPLRIKKISNKEIKSTTNDIINKLGLEKEKHKYPNQVSGGQLQRTAIARALVTNPKIVLADEPTGALDSKNSKIIMDALKDISKDRLVIMVTHNEELAKSYASRIIRLNDGKIESQEDISINEKKESNVNKKENFKYIS
ncbi:MAG: ABC transporter ATP-binding protein, partial [Bacilli bacterium]|nr:ABC transporter ATP-binding protein [Bacilli bacterium]